jgi:hypothetical protein
MIGALGTTYISKLTAATIIFGIATVGDVQFGLGLLSALVSGLAVQGLTAKRQEQHTDNAIRLGRFRLEIEGYVGEIPVADHRRLKEIQRRLEEIVNQLPADANLPLAVASIPYYSTGSSSARKS